MTADVCSPLGAICGTTGKCPLATAGDIRGCLAGGKSPNSVRHQLNLVHALPRMLDAARKPVDAAEVVYADVFGAEVTDAPSHLELPDETVHAGVPAHAITQQP